MPLCFYAFKKFLLKTHKLQSVNLQLFKLEPWARPQLIHLEDHIKTHTCGQSLSLSLSHTHTHTHTHTLHLFGLVVIDDIDPHSSRMSMNWCHGLLLWNLETPSGHNSSHLAYMRSLQVGDK